MGNHDKTSAPQETTPGQKETKDTSEITQPLNWPAVLKEEESHILGLRNPPNKLQEGESPKFIGLALSGGGIRSATFSLGVLQALAEKKWLRKFHYLSTVSGGGYIGCWLSAYIYRTRKNTSKIDAIEHIEKCMSPSDNMQDKPECKEITFLRAYSNYLTPRLGGLSGDSLALLAGYTRNFLINMIVLTVYGFLFCATIRFIAVLLSTIVGCLIDSHIPCANYIPYANNVNPILLLGSIFLIFAVGCLSYTLTIPSGLEPSKYKRLWLRAVYRATAILFGLSLLFISAWLFTRAPPVQDNFWKYFCTLIILGILIILSNFIGNWVAYRALSNPNGLQQTALKKTIKLYYGWKEFFRNIVVTLIICVFGALLWIWSMIDASEHLAKFVAGTTTPPGILYSVAFGPSIAITGLWLIYILWVGALGRWYTEFTRETLNLLFGVLTVAALLWAALGTIIVIAGSELSIACFYTIAGTTTDGYGLGIVAVTGIAIACSALVLGLRARQQRSMAQRPRRRTDRALLTLVMNLLSLALGILLVYVLIIGVQKVTGLIPFEWEFVRALVAFIVIGAFAFVCGIIIDINIFSMQNIYRNRLVRCYLGATNAQRRPKPRGGFDPSDDLELSNFKDQLPFLLINASLNLTKGPPLAWQNRRAGSFIFSPLHCGYWLPHEELPHEEATPSSAPSLGSGTFVSYQRGGYWPTKEYAKEPEAEPEAGGRKSDKSKGIMVGTAMATSGAAVSPQMGPASSKPRAFLLTLLNIRLGRWLPNPARGGSHAVTPPIYSYLGELFLGTDEKNKGIYVTDGGHFENLGIYELVRRRCHQIVFVDAGADPERNFGDLGNAIQKCRVDFGVSIEIDTSKLKIDSGGKIEEAFAVGTITYPPVCKDALPVKGTLLYIKPSIPESWKEAGEDIRSYQFRHPEFPHQPTINQWFSETQFESYRYLGYQIGKEAIDKYEEAELVQSYRLPWRISLCLQCDYKR